MKGPVVAVDQQAHTFTCQWKTTRWTYKTTNATTFRVGRRLGSWSNVKLGAVVSKVRFVDKGLGAISQKLTLQQNVIQIDSSLLDLKLSILRTRVLTPAICFLTSLA